MTYSLLAIFGAGLATLLTPCVLPLIPVYFAMLLGEGVTEARRGWRRFALVGVTGAFVAGFTAVFTLLGLGAARLGTALADHRSTLLLVGAGSIFLFGLRFLGLLRLPFLERTGRFAIPSVAGSWPRAMLFGAVFALGWTPCVGPVLASVLAWTATAAHHPMEGAAFLAVYGLGMGAPLLVLSAVADRALPQLRRLYAQLPRIERLSGATMVLLALYLGYGAWQTLAAPNQTAALPPATGRARLVEFYGESCTVCQEMKPHIEKLRTSCPGAEVEIIQVDVTRPENAALAHAHGVRALPTFAWFDGQGEETGRRLGRQGPGELRDVTTDLTGVVCAHDPRPAPPPPPTAAPSGEGCDLEEASAGLCQG